MGDARPLLIVEDDPFVRWFLATALRAGGHTVVEPEAMLREREPVVVDLQQRDPLACEAHVARVLSAPDAVVAVAPRARVGPARRPGGRWLRAAVIGHRLMLPGALESEVGRLRRTRTGVRRQRSSR